MNTAEPLKTLRSRNLAEVNKGKRRTHTFRVDFTDINPDFVGTLTVHHPTQLERIQIGITKANLLGGLTNVDVMTDNIAHVISTLDVVLDDKPQWFDIDSDELDYEILESVFLEYVEWMNSFRRKANTPDAIEQSSTDNRSEIPVVDTEEI